MILVSIDGSIQVKGGYLNHSVTGVGGMSSSESFVLCVILFYFFEFPQGL